LFITQCSLNINYLAPIGILGTIYFSFPDGGNKACNKIWQLISFDPARFSFGLNDTQGQDIVKTKIQVSPMLQRIGGIGILLSFNSIFRCIG
jgi:hypothetical protein